ncbi:hypothetical protein FPZ12_012850 [Amycolatopsis acidicola]|uniref:Uncharacterized protein n=1 Tax=Amycolatopsis acidicola TaxID=2596893 RepID=A0A5N0V6Q8_9PSEU|nr:hypothetical protein [Amycolatopsis acidicola]KAA9162119.1 hypothetical protein FPZ12_012850 [Amycolatopsis acidicola]
MSENVAVCLANLAGRLHEAVLAAPPAPEVVLGPAAVRDWFIVFGHAQSLFRDRWRRSLWERAVYEREGYLVHSKIELLWLQHVQDQLATAALAC